MKKLHPALAGYAEFLGEVQSRIQIAQVTAARGVNRDLILLYWDVGRGIAQKQEALGWGQSVVEILSRDLQRMFPLPHRVSRRTISGE